MVLGAALTGLGASESSHVLITLFGAANTIIAGLVAYLKSRGQPMRARMFRDDLERVVDEIENSEVMWRGEFRLLLLLLLFFFVFCFIPLIIYVLWCGCCDVMMLPP